MVKQNSVEKFFSPSPSKSGTKSNTKSNIISLFVTLQTFEGDSKIEVKSH